MKKIIKRVFLALAIIICILIIAILAFVFFGGGTLITPIPKKDHYELVVDAKYLPKLAVDGNLIIDETGRKVSLEGLMVTELQRLSTKKNFSKEYFEEVFSCGGNVIRIPIHPESWLSDEYYLWRYLDPVVTWAIENEKYIILDLHFIGNIINGSGSEMQDVGENPLEFSKDFWHLVASYFSDVPNAIFEIYNEPASINAKDWTASAEELISTSRRTGAKQLILVSGIDYSYDLSCWENVTILDENIAYVAHVFPNRYGWEQNLKKISEERPVVVTEWGYISEKEYAKQSYLIGSREEYGKPFYDFMTENNIGWVACWYDDVWEPQIFRPQTKELMDWGEFALEILKD